MATSVRPAAAPLAAVPRPHSARATACARSRRAPARPAGPQIVARGVKVGLDGQFDSDAIDIDTLDLEDPFGTVEDVMTTLSLRAATPDQPLSSAASKLDKVTGLAVVNEENVVVGVISIKDINRVKKAGGSLEQPVSSVMSTPPIVVRKKARVAEAAAIMMARKIHRLPVVNEKGVLIGIVSRSDIFRPMLTPRANAIDALTIIGKQRGGEAALASLQRSIDEDDINTELASQDAWTIAYLYDGDCSMCNALVAMLKRADEGRGLIKFVNIASMAYNPAENEGILYEEAMETIHAIRRADAAIIKGPAALKELYRTVGLGWAAQLGDLPVISQLVDLVYEVLGRLRLPMGKGMDAMMAMRRMKMTNEGIEHCVDDEEACEAEW